MRLSNPRYGFFLNVPGLLIVLLWVIFPAFLLFYTSFLRYDNVHPIIFNGLRNYQKVLDDRLFWIGMKQIAIFSIGTTVLTASGGLIIALCLSAITRAEGSSGPS